MLDGEVIYVPPRIDFARKFLLRGEKTFLIKKTAPFRTAANFHKFRCLRPGVVFARIAKFTSTSYESVVNFSHYREDTRGWRNSTFVYVRRDI